MKKYSTLAACLAAFILLASCLMKPEAALGERRATLRPLPTYPFIRYDENALQFPGGHLRFDTLYQRLDCSTLRTSTFSSFSCPHFRYPVTSTKMLVYGL